PAWICQRFRNSYHYATLYDRDRRIPVYSAYKYQPGPGDRSKSWFVEPQLIDPEYVKDMYGEDYIEMKYKITPEKTGQSQAINKDYKHLQSLNLERGHLSPSCHHTGNNKKWATFTLTNIVPQDSTLNKGAWNDYETTTMKEKTNGCETTYVIVGILPGNNYISGKRVNVPSHIWSAACCVVGTKPKKAWAVIAENNKKNKVQELSLGQLEARLRDFYGGRMITLFNNACPRQ
ncbi:ENDD1 protein, partial [Aegithalos caudatus]|nr:ENDD1 protein [Aegithalos caudatus]